MARSTSARTRPDFGLDAPPVVRAFAGVAAGGLVLLACGLALGRTVAPAWWALAPVGLLWLLTGLGSVLAMIRSSRVGKIAVRDRVLDGLAWRGDEDVLDLGCGRGLMLLGAAQRAPRGTATGIDLWRSADQRGSSRENCLANARALGVADRITLVDGDMAALPWPDGTFDLVTAVLSVHNLPERARRAATVREAARVLRPGGRLLLIDFTRTAEYAEDARAAGLVAVTRSGRQVAMYPFVRIVSASKSEYGPGA